MLQGRLWEAEGGSGSWAILRGHWPGLAQGGSGKQSPWGVSEASPSLVISLPHCTLQLNQPPPQGVHGDHWTWGLELLPHPRQLWE